MNCLLWLAIINSVTCTLALQLQNVFEYEIKDFEEQMDNTMNKKLHNFYKYVGALKSDADTSSSDQKNVKLQSFSWDDCGTSAALVKIKSLSISPDPVKDPITISADFAIKKDLVGPLKTDLKLKKKIGFLWIEVPCIDDIGSCTYDDVCKLASQITQCPAPVVKMGSNCRCPYVARSYILPKTEFELNLGDVPSGEYKIDVTITQNEEEAVCLNIGLTFA